MDAHELSFVIMKGSTLNRFLEEVKDAAVRVVPV
jgi:hypothetical protein